MVAVEEIHCESLYNWKLTAQTFHIQWLTISKWIRSKRNTLRKFQTKPKVKAWIMKIEKMKLEFFGSEEQGSSEQNLLVTFYNFKYRENF